MKVVLAEKPSVAKDMEQKKIYELVFYDERNREEYNKIQYARSIEEIENYKAEQNDSDFIIVFEHTFNKNELQGFIEKYIEDPFSDYESIEEIVNDQQLMFEIITMYSNTRKCIDLIKYTSINRIESKVI